MIEIPFLADLFLVLLVGAGIGFVFERGRLPTLVGFLFAGLLLGPRTTGLVGDLHSIELLAEIGVVMLLFTIGVELSLEQVVKLRRAVLLGGGVQVVATGALAAAGAMLAGLQPGPAVFIGFVVALSSTAIVLRLLGERAETAAPHGNLSVGLLIFQDLAVVPMVLLVPILAGNDEGAGGIAWTLIKAVAVVVVTLVVARRIVPVVLRAVVATRSRELFLLVTLAICLGTAWATSQAGLSLGLGAFLAGLVISESEYGHHAFSLTVPFRDAFSVVFFVSVGMLIDVGYVAGHLGAVFGVTLAVLALKAGVIGLVVAPVLRVPVRVGLLAGLLLSQVGEFSFLLLHVGARHEIVPDDVRSLWMAVAGVSMAFAPLLLRAAPGLSRWAASLGPGRDSKGGEAPAGHTQVLVVGFGVAGRNVARALRHVGVPYSVLEMNPETVRKLKAEGEPIEYGDAGQPEALVHADVEHVRIVVVTVPDPASARRIVSLVRALNPSAHVVVRTRFVTEVAALRKLGANDVVPEEFETSLEILGRVLRTLVVPRETVDRVCREIRAEEYGMLRALESDPAVATALPPSFGQAQVEVFRVAPESELAGVALHDARLPDDGLLVLAVSRDETTTSNPPADFGLEAGDAVLVLGTPDQLAAAATRFGGA